MSQRDSQFGHHTAADYDRILGEGQSASDFVDANGNDLYNQPKGTKSEAQVMNERRNNIGMDNSSHFGYHDVDDYNKILGEGQDDYKPGEQLEMFQREQQQQQHLHQQNYPPTHLYGKNEDTSYLNMEDQSYQKETKEMERDNIDNPAIIPGCGKGTKREMKHHYISNNFQPESQLQARKMDFTHIHKNDMDTTCPSFEGEGHHTPIPGAGKMDARPGYHHVEPFHLIKNDQQVEQEMGMGMGSEAYHYETTPTATDQAVPRIMTQQQEKKTEYTGYKEPIFSKLKKTISK